MKPSGLHILLTYQCTCECDHCFVWGSPKQSGTLSIAQLEQALLQAREAGITSVYFEGGEPFLYYAILVRGVQKAAALGFSVGIVSNAYWAWTVEDASAWLEPFAGLVDDLTVSSDLFHCNETLGEQAQNAIVAAKWLGIPTGMISIAQPEQTDAPSVRGQIVDQGAVMYRGRAASMLAPKAPQHPWTEFTSCPYEDLREPGRVHLDPRGHVQICQGISLGNIFETPLDEICANYNPEAHCICGPLLSGGPVALVTEYSLPHRPTYADACELCYQARTALRSRCPEILAPDQMYGIEKS